MGTEITTASKRFKYLLVFLMALSWWQTATAATCPLKTPRQWQKFIEFHSDHDAWTATCEDGTCDAEFVEFVKQDIESVFTVCADYILQHPGIAKCTANYRRFLPPWLRQHDDVSYGFDVSNEEYLRQQESADKPAGMMNVPQAIVDALPDRNKVEEAARKNGFKYLTHDSAIEGIRTFVLNPDPNGRFDQWLLLNLVDGDSAKASTTMPVSVLAVEKKDAKGKALKKVRLHFRDYDIHKKKEGFELQVKLDGNGKCYSCHTNGVRQLIARRTPVLQSQPSRGEGGFTEQGTATNDREFAYDRLLEFNRRLRSYGQPDWDEKIHPANHGPVLGGAQGCVDCHDGKSRGALNLATSTTQLEKKMYNELSMPYDTSLPQLLERSEMNKAQLRPDEKAKLESAFHGAEKLMNEYFDSRLPELQKWLLESRCS